MCFVDCAYRLSHSHCFSSSRDWSFSVHLWHSWFVVRLGPWGLGTGALVSWGRCLRSPVGTWCCACPVEKWLSPAARYCGCAKIRIMTSLSLAYLSTEVATDRSIWAICAGAEWLTAIKAEAAMTTRHDHCIRGSCETDQAFKPQEVLDWSNLLDFLFQPFQLSTLRFQHLYIDIE